MPESGGLLKLAVCGYSEGTGAHFEAYDENLLESGAKQKGIKLEQVWPILACGRSSRSRQKCCRVGRVSVRSEVLHNIQKREV